MVNLNDIATIEVIEVGHPSVAPVVIDIGINVLPVAEIIVATAAIAGPLIAEVAVPGMQGPPGLQNVHVSAVEPQDPNINDIWIQI